MSRLSPCRTSDPSGSRWPVLLTYWNVSEIVERPRGGVNACAATQWPGSISAPAIAARASRRDDGPIAGLPEHYLELLVAGALGRDAVGGSVDQDARRVGRPGAALKPSAPSDDEELIAASRKSGR